jgi:hypothetical protein
MNSLNAFGNKTCDRTYDQTSSENVHVHTYLTKTRKFVQKALKGEEKADVHTQKYVPLSLSACLSVERERTNVVLGAEPFRGANSR